MWTLETICWFCLSNVIDIDQYLLKLFENIVGVQFFNHSVLWIKIVPKNAVWK